jgi:DNA primase
VSVPRLKDPEFRQFIERVKLRAPIEVVVGERVSELRRRGALHWARCPFHEEKTPSFAVDPRRGTWRCFGACAEGGDVLSFVERFDGLSFLDALRLLARQVGEELPEPKLRARARGDEARTEKRLDVVRWAAGQYRRAFAGPEGAAARSYLEERGLGAEVVEAFGLGWAPDSGRFLVARAESEGKPIEPLLEAELLRRSESGRAYDFFRGRLLIPIRDRLGRVVGFGGRTLATGPDAGPKYVNTPETPLFHKGQLIFGLDLAAPEVRRTGRLLIVEGYTDVMAAHQAGWTCATAVLGTATTPDHAALIRRTGARTVVLVFDGDGAGAKASERALAGLLRLPVELRVAVLPEGTDPGDLLVDPSGRAEFESRIENAVDWFDWTLAGLEGLRGAALIEAVEARFGLIALLENPVEQASRLTEMARTLGLPVEDLRAQWSRWQGTRARRPERVPETLAIPSDAVRPVSHVSGGLEKSVGRAYASLLGAFLVDNSLVSLHRQHVEPLLEEAPDSDLATFLRTFLDLYDGDTTGEPIDASATLTALVDHPRRALVLRLEERAREAESAEVLARENAGWLERRNQERELVDLAHRINEDADPATLARLHDRLRHGRVPTPDPASVAPH